MVVLLGRELHSAPGFYALCHAHADAACADGYIFTDGYAFPDAGVFTDGYPFANINAFTDTYKHACSHRHADIHAHHPPNPSPHQHAHTFTISHVSPPAFSYPHLATPTSLFPRSPAWPNVRHPGRVLGRVCRVGAGIVRRGPARG